MPLQVPTYELPDTQFETPRPAYADYGPGPGPSIERLGQTATQGATELGRAAVMYQEQKNAVVAQQKLMTGQQSMMDQSLHIMSATGVDAQGMTDRMRDLANSTLSSMLEGTTPGQAKMIQGMWQRFAIGRIEAAAAQEVTQHRVTMQQTAIGMGAIARNIAAQDPTNQASLEAAAQQAANAWAAAHAGAPEAEFTAGQAAARSGVYKSAILSRAQTDPMGAEGMLQQFGPNLFGPDFIETQAHLRPMLLKARTDAFSASLGLPGDGTPDGVWQRMIGRESGGRQTDATGAPLVSKAGAVGAAQVLPETGQKMAAALGIAWDPQRFATDREYNMRLGRAFYDQMLDRYSGSPLLAAAAYNAGPERVDQWIAQNGDPRSGAISPAAWAARIPIAETRGYVQAVGAAPGAGQTAQGQPPQGAAQPGFVPVGDSIAQGLAQAGGMTGVTQVGATPQDVMTAIQGMDPAAVAGRTVLLSSGASNNTAQLGLVDQQIAALRAKGAAGVRLLGVGDRPDFAGVNEKLAAAASRGGATFTGPVEAGGDHVHPKDYAATLAAVRGAGPDQPAAAASAGGPPDLNAWIAKAKDAAAGDPELEQRFIAAATERYNHWQAATHVARADLERTLPDVQRALEGGVNVTVPEAQIRALLPPPQADRVLAGLAVSQVAGQAFASIDMASPQQAQQVEHDLATGTGNYSAMIRVRGGKLTGPGMVQADAAAAPDPTAPAPDGPVAQTDPKDAGAAAAAPTLAAGVSPVTGESAELFGLRRAVLGKYQSLLAQRDAALKADPAAYVAARDPLVRARMQALAQAPDDPAAKQAAENALLAEQARLGVASPRLLTNDEVATTVRAIEQTDPAQASVGDQLDKLSARYGALWPQAFGELVQHGKLNPQYQTLAAMDQPSQMAARDDLQRALAMTSQAKGGAKTLEDAAPMTANRAITQDIDDDANLSALRKAFSFSSGGLQAYANVKQSVRTLATYYAWRDGDTGDTALARASDAILGQKYDFSGTMLAPKGQLGAVQTATDGVVSHLTAQDMAPLPKTAPGATPDDMAQAALDAARAGTWVPNQDTTGLVLMGKLSNGAAIPLRRADGSPVQVLFGSLPSFPATPVTPTPPPPDTAPDEPVSGP